ncbi:MAG: hypothetical protein ACSLE9_07850 [Burkholderiaceae bacterium]
MVFAERITRDEWKAQPKLARCRECGHRVARTQYYERVSCPEHPTAELIPWREGAGLAVAEYYLVNEAVYRLGLAGTALDRWVQVYDTGMYPVKGDRGTMALMLGYLRRWGWPAPFGSPPSDEMPDLPAPAGDITLYGRRRP